MKPEGAMGHLGLTEVYRHRCWVMLPASLAAHCLSSLFLCNRNDAWWAPQDSHLTCAVGAKCC